MLRILEAAHGAYADPDCTQHWFAAEHLAEILPLDGDDLGPAPFGDCPLVRVPLPDGSDLFVPATRTETIQ